MSENKLTVAPAVSRGPIVRPILLGLSISCVVGFAVTLFLKLYGADSQMPANATNFIVPNTSIDKWSLFAMWVIAAPLFEEWLIRGVLYRSLRRNWSVWMKRGRVGCAIRDAASSGWVHRIGRAPAR